MGHYRARDLILPPSLVSFVRVPLAALFPVVVESPALAVAVLAAAGATDVIDGWYARRFNQATATGAVVDGVTDKIFVASVVITLVVVQKLGWIGVVLLALREIGELPLVAWWTVSRHQRRRKSREPRANIPGKLATVLQFVTVGAITMELAYQSVLLVLTAVVGAIAAIIYWLREVAPDPGPGARARA